MVYVDLNVGATARVAGELQRLGYATVCVNVDCESSEKPKPATALPDLPQSAQKDKSGKAAKKAKLYTVALGNGLQLKDARSDKELPRQRKRITLKLEEVADAQKLVPGIGCDGYDVVAAEAATPKVFQFLCEQADIDLITFDVTNRLPFQLKRPWVRLLFCRLK
ncbi:Ribonuclease P protein subunit p30 [Phytophthora megakarya]|uniref:Ribonuclease P protein subunit p30 n=1 Tax=Phytophthora megakarya TaxID=4795 RepID=A0A225UFJ6_9STRA|nr:Ribonuclease P protein subunit p30 [Phytophthora megakarya]